MNRKSEVLASKFYGIGVGPGDPKLLTMKAKEILEDVSIIFVPKAKSDGGSRAQRIVKKAISKKAKFVELHFPMTKDNKILRDAWHKATRKIVEELEKGKDAAFVSIGDPFIYSTYIYLLNALRRDFPQLKVETIPGISSFNSAASSIQIPLVIGNERLAILPAIKSLKGFKRVFKEFDTVVLMKVNSKLDEIVHLLEELGLIKNAVFASNVGHNNEKVVYDLTSLIGKKVGYHSLIIVRCREGNERRYPS
jgi:precorrin-2/cobalt-factor-2 C20-methyltransferase